MKDYILAFSILGIVFLLIYKPAKKAVTKTIETLKTMTRGYRNNNPGNIRLTFNSDGSKRFWKGEVEGTDKAFKTFSSMAYGYRALFALLKEYIGKGYNTIETIINRYAPASENATDKYIQTVEKRTGITRNTKIAASDLITLTKVVSAISFVENGQPADEVQIYEGKKLLS